ncbi:hypothetical protein [Shewanella donghaensis]|uniref:hypothetical protein n=1 Tax=Shewanella donghaensis TaxID=238836 RepID=UPI0011823B66|nr:hypothetical protein [Shewanella donghaensis]
MRTTSIFATIAGSILLTACAAKPPIVAQEKTVEFDGQTLIFAGTFDTEKNKLQLSVNGDPLMKGSFPPYTPTQNLKSKYRDLKIEGKCYFGSVLGDQGGAFGAIAGIIQSTKSSTGDKCEMFVNNQPMENLYF